MYKYLLSVDFAEERKDRFQRKGDLSVKLCNFYFVLTLR